MIAFRASGIAVTGVLQTILDVFVSGVGPVRLSVFNRGFTALSAGRVDHLGAQAPASPQPVSPDTTTFGTLAAQASAQLVIPAPVERIRFQATCTAGSGTGRVAEHAGAGAVSRERPAAARRLLLLPSDGY